MRQLAACDTGWPNSGMKNGIRFGDTTANNVTKLQWLSFVACSQRHSSWTWRTAGRFQGGRVREHRQSALKTRQRMAKRVTTTNWTRFISHRDDQYWALSLVPFSEFRIDHVNTCALPSVLEAVAEPLEGHSDAPLRGEKLSWWATRVAKKQPKLWNQNKY